MTSTCPAGINTAGKFHECMQVMKKIILHVLDIKQRKVEEGNHEEEVQKAKETTEMSHSSIDRGRGGPRRHRQQHKGKGRRANSTPYHKRDVLLPAQLENDHFVATHVDSTCHCPDNSAVFQTESSDVTVSSSPSRAGAKASALHSVPESGLSSSLSRHSSGFGSEGSSAKLEWSEDTPSPIAIPAHKAKSKYYDDEAHDQHLEKYDGRGGISNGRVSPIHAWVNPAPSSYESSTSTSIVSSTPSR